jgi:predicted transcriptional regulator
MSTLTIRLPDDKHLRLRELARRRSMSINKLMEELATISITEFDAETRFRALAARGSAKKGLALLDKLDAAFAAKTK